MLEIFRDQGMRGNGLAYRQRHLDCVADQAVAFQLHLPAGDIKAGDQLLVGAGRSVREDRLMELRLDGVEINVLHQQHRALPQGGHRLVRRMGLIDPQVHLTRIRNKPRIQQFFSRRILAELGLLLLIGRHGCRIAAARLRYRWPRPLRCAGAGTAKIAQIRTTPRPTGRSGPA